MCLRFRSRVAFSTNPLSSVHPSIIGATAWGGSGISEDRRGVQAKPALLGLPKDAVRLWSSGFIRGFASSFCLLARFVVEYRIDGSMSESVRRTFHKSLTSCPLLSKMVPNRDVCGCFPKGRRNIAPNALPEIKSCLGNTSTRTPSGNGRKLSKKDCAHWRTVFAGVGSVKQSQRCRPFPPLSSSSGFIPCSSNASSIRIAS